MHQGRGYQYVNLVPKELSEKILLKIKPRLIFSGDDHDDCVFSHETHENSVIEV